MFLSLLQSAVPPVVDRNDLPKLRLPLESVVTSTFSPDALKGEDVDPHPRHVEDLMKLYFPFMIITLLSLKSYHTPLEYSHLSLYLLDVKI